MAPSSCASRQRPLKVSPLRVFGVSAEPHVPRSVAYPCPLAPCVVAFRGRFFLSVPCLGCDVVCCVSHPPPFRTTYPDRPQVEKDKGAPNTDATDTDAMAWAMGRVAATLALAARQVCVTYDASPARRCVRLCRPILHSPLALLTGVCIGTACICKMWGPQLVFRTR